MSFSRNFSVSTVCRMAGETAVCHMTSDCDGVKERTVKHTNT